MFFKTGVIRNFPIFTGKHVLQSFLIKFQALQPATLFQPHPKRDFYTGDPMKIAKFLQTAFFMEHLW